MSGRILVELLDDAERRGEFVAEDKELTAEMIQSANMKFRYPQLWSKLTLPKLERELEGVLKLITEGLCSQRKREQVSAGRGCVKAPFVRTSCRALYAHCSVALFVSVLSLGLGAAVPGFQHEMSDSDKSDLDRVSAYLNAIHTLKAAFVQIGPEGQVDQGTFYIEKPGRMRFEYTPPNPTLVVSDGSTAPAVENQKTQHGGPLSALVDAAQSHFVRTT